MALAKISNNTNDGLRVEAMNTPISPPTSATTGSDMTVVVGTTNQTSSLTVGTKKKTLIPPLNMFSWCGNLLKKLPSGRFEIQKSIAKSETQTNNGGLKQNFLTVQCFSATILFQKSISFAVIHKRQWRETVWEHEQR